MRYLIIILLFNTVKAQDYIMKFKTVGLEPLVVNYQPQVSKDSNGTYVTLVTLAPKKRKDSNIYTYTIYPPTVKSYYKVKTLLSKGQPLYTKPIKIINTNVDITNAIVKVQSNSDNLSFNATNEGAVDYYSYEKSTNSGTSWSIVGKVYQKGFGKYVINVSKSGATRLYKVRAFYKSGIKSPYFNFSPP